MRGQRRGSVGLATTMIRALRGAGAIHTEALPACPPEASSGSSFPGVPGTRGSSHHPRGSLAALILIAASEREIGAAQIRRGLGPPPGGRSPGLPASPRGPSETRTSGRAQAAQVEVPLGGKWPAGNLKRPPGLGQPGQQCSSHESRPLDCPSRLYFEERGPARDTPVNRKTKSSHMPHQPMI